MKGIIDRLEENILQAGKTNEYLKRSLNEKQKICEKLEVDLAFLLKKTETKSVQDRYVNSSKLLNKIISEQRDPCNKTGLGYSPRVNQKNVKTYADALCNTFIR